MKINLLNPCGGGYVTPAIKVVEFQPEGVLCASTKQYGSGIDDLTETEFDWSNN